MRIGNNPEKNKNLKITYKQHRVIIPVYIPNSKESYFNNLFEVFKVSINSLLNTIDKDQTNITIINNNCKEEVTIFIDSLLKKKEIDKHIKYKDNYGKVYTVLSEVKGVFESIVTIADADVLYFSGWENEVIKIINMYPKVGVVSPLPMPHLAYYNNISLFIDKFLKIKRGRIVSDESFKLWEEGISNKAFNKWKKQQLYIEKNSLKACLGAGHFVSTYRNKVLKKCSEYVPEYVFKNGDENNALDLPIDKLGYYRLSTVKTYVYHLGNTIPSWCKEKIFTEEKQNKFIDYYEKNKLSLKFHCKKIVFKFLRKYKII